MSELFIPSTVIPISDNVVMKEYISSKEHDLPSSNKGTRGYVFAYHQTTDNPNKWELVDQDNNHIVLVGRRWLMQRAVGGSLTETPGQHQWIINWFSVGEGGANSSDPINVLYTPDQQEDLIAPIKIENIYIPGYAYSDSGNKKTFIKHDGINAQMKYDHINSEVLALYHLQLDYQDCPYDLPNLGVNINELALYASPNDLPTNDQYVMFSRYCLPTKFKSFRDKYLFLWYIYF